MRAGLDILVEPTDTTPAGVLHVTVTWLPGAETGVTAPPLSGIVTAMVVVPPEIAHPGRTVVETVAEVELGPVISVGPLTANAGPASIARPMLDNNNFFIFIPFLVVLRFFDQSGWISRPRKLRGRLNVYGYGIGVFTRDGLTILREHF